jgi:thiamine-phosphate diphosphorylase
LKQTRGGDASRLLFTGIYALVSPAGGDPVAYVEALLAGGVRLFQIRAKHGIVGDMLAAIITRVHAQRGLVIINDDVVLAAQADGVHLGQEDAAGHDLRAVRVALGTKAIGLSCATPAQARAPVMEFVDYIGAGPIFATPSKPDAGSPIGVNGVRAVVAATDLPVAAIGGITLDRLDRVRESGAAMAAIISGLAIGADPAATARAYVDAWNR